MNRTQKILASAAILGTAAGVAGFGTYATFTDTDSRNQTLSTGTVIMDLAPDGASNQLNIGASRMVPGDSVQRRVVVNNTGTEDLSLLTLTTTAAASTLLTSDTTNGLQMVIQRCTGAPWVGTLLADTNGYTYTCAGTTTSILASSPILGSVRDLSAINAMGALGNTNGSDDLRITVTLPSTADNTFQNLSTTLTYRFDATQRNAVSK